MDNPAEARIPVGRGNFAAWEYNRIVVWLPPHVDLRVRRRPEELRMTEVVHAGHPTSFVEFEYLRELVSGSC